MAAHEDRSAGGKTLADLVAEARAQIREVMPDELSEAMEEGEPWLIVDVREPYEYERLHVPGSVLIPRGLLEGAADPQSPHRIEALCTDRERPLALLCSTGARSAFAAVVLEQMGFGKVVNIAGGIKLWESEDLPTARGPWTGPLP
jgi:rhodanese-related sulfurtransferase